MNQPSEHNEKDTDLCINAECIKSRLWRNGAMQRYCEEHLEEGLQKEREDADNLPF